MNSKDFKIANDAIKLDPPYYSLSGSDTSNMFDAVRDRLICIKQHYADCIRMIKEDMERIRLEFDKHRAYQREIMQYIWTMTHKVSGNDGSTYFTIIRTPEYIISGDEDYCKVITYGSFRLVNDVFIGGGGYQFNGIATGDVASTEERMQLLQDIVPERFKQTKRTTL